MELKKYKLGELGKVITGKTPKTSKKENFDNGVIPFYTPEDIARGIGITGKNERFITEIGLSEIKNNSLEDESVLVGCIGSDMGNVAYTNHRCAMNQQINAITSFKDYICPLYVYYYLSTKKQEFRKIAGATTTPILPKSVFCDYIILLPKYHIQRKIASVLYNIDRKIEINRAINQNLEAMAKQLYDYWFVQFDFPDENGRPYKSSGGKMVWNEKLKREIPKSWKVLSVNDISQSFRGVSYTKSDLTNENQGVLVLRGNNIQDNKLIYDSNVAYIPQSFVSIEQKICKGDIIMTMSSGSKEHIGKCVLFHHNACETYGAFLTKFSPHPHCSFILYNVFNSAYFKAKIKSIASGTGINNLTNQTFDNIYIALPPMEILKEFDELQNEIFSEVGVLQQDTWHLTKQRDELLPLLMNGQVSVNSDLAL